MASNISDSATIRYAVVTGANKGIGMEICRELASSGIMVVLTARDEKRGLEAVAKLHESGLSNVVFHQLDVMDAKSIVSLAKFIAINYGKLDILVNNAGIRGCTVDWEPLKTLKREDCESSGDVAKLIIKGLEQTCESAEEGIKINYYGTKAVTEALLPCLLLSNSGRIVNVSSVLGMLQFVSNERVRRELNEADVVLSVERVDEMVNEYLEDFKEDRLQEKGWGLPPIQTSAYTMSKAAMNAYTRITAKSYPTLLINCVCPGFIKTDMTSHTGFSTADAGARGPVMLALLSDGGPSGLFFQNMKPSIF